MSYIKGNPCSPFSLPHREQSAITPPCFEGERDPHRASALGSVKVLSINTNDIIADINKKNMFSIGTYLVNNMKNDLDSIQMTFQEMMTQSIHMLDVLTKMVDSQEQQSCIFQDVSQEEDSYVAQEIQIQYPDSIFMNEY